MIPEESVAEQNDTSVEVNRHKETSYTMHADSLQKWAMSDVY